MRFFSLWAYVVFPVPGLQEDVFAWKEERQIRTGRVIVFLLA